MKNISGSTTDAEIKRLKEENAQLKEAIAMLKFQLSN
jgi:hypothetical protein